MGGQSAPLPPFGNMLGPSCIEGDLCWHHLFSWDSQSREGLAALLDEGLFDLADQ